MAQATETTHGVLRPGAGRAHFELRRTAPSDDLAEHVECAGVAAGASSTARRASSTAAPSVQRRQPAFEVRAVHIDATEAFLRERRPAPDRRDDLVREVVKAIPAADPGTTGASPALDLGYFDQSHFIRDFTAQIGMPPSLYERACAVEAGRPEPVRA